MKPAIAFAVLCLMLSACATATGVLTFEAALRAAGMSVDAYCALSPDGRAEIRARANLPHLIACPNDPKSTAGWGNKEWAADPDVPLPT